MSTSDSHHHVSNKKQKLLDHSSSSREDSCSSKDHKITESNLSKNKIIASLDMCFFCFDVLGSHLKLNEEPIPKFSNESQ